VRKGISISWGETPFFPWDEREGVSRGRGHQGRRRGRLRTLAAGSGVSEPNDAAQSGPEPPPAESSYRPKPPLWTPHVQKERPFLVTVALEAVALVAGGAVLAVVLESRLLSVPLGQVEVKVVRVQGGSPQDESPASFRHMVVLPDGSERLFISEQIHRPGERIVVSLSRGRITGRLWLGAPYRVLPLPRQAP
jgi:hypothetical protein